MKQKLQYRSHGLSAFVVLFFCLFSACSTNTTTEEVALPTEGLVTVLKEVQKDQFKIEDEITVPDTSKSLVVAKYMDEKIDTFTLAEIRLMKQSSETNYNGIATAAGLGLFGYFMGRSMASRPPASAYTDPKTHQRVSNTAGNKMQQTAARTTRTRPSSGKSGYGSGRSTRSTGG